MFYTRNAVSDPASSIYSPMTPFAGENVSAKDVELDLVCIKIKINHSSP